MHRGEIIGGGDSDIVETLYTERKQTVGRHVAFTVLPRPTTSVRYIDTDWLCANDNKLGCSGWLLQHASSGTVSHYASSDLSLWLGLVLTVEPYTTCDGGPAVHHDHNAHTWTNTVHCPRTMINCVRKHLRQT
jgi:hypothetical protein